MCKAFFFFRFVLKVTSDHQMSRYADHEYFRRFVEFLMLEGDKVTSLTLIRGLLKVQRLVAIMNQTIDFFKLSRRDDR